MVGIHGPYLLKNRGIYFFLLSLLTMAGCSSGLFHSTVVKSSSSLLYEAGRDLETENDFELFKDAVPGNLKLVEGLLSIDPKNTTLLATLTKGYSAYAFAVRETQYYELSYGNKKEEEIESAKTQALASYNKAFEFGKRYFEARGLALEKLIEIQSDSDAVKKLLDQNFNSSKEDLETVLFTAQSLGTIINHRKDEMRLIARLPLVKSLFDWTCGRKPDLLFGACDIFFGTYEISRPKMLGGNPEKGKEIFKAAIAKYPSNWLIPVSYLQYGVIPLSDEDEFKMLAPQLDLAMEQFENSKQYSVEDKKIDLGDKEQRFFQMIAMKRWTLMKKYQKNLF